MTGWLPLFSARAEEESLGIDVPPGFEVTLYAPDALAHDIFSMTVDSHGNLVVAGRDYVKTLFDDNHNGRAERAVRFSKLPHTGAHGMVFIGDDLLCTGDSGLWLFHDHNRDRRADRNPSPEMWSLLRHPEHGGSGVVQGPDGWFYVMCGNDTGVTAAHVTLHSSPVLRPENGTVLRFSPDGKQCEVVVHGLRNPYDFAFHPLGNLLTIDSDGERDQYLPWYSPVRFFDLAPGMHHGWVMDGWTHSWNRPESFFDNVPRLDEIGRGSPTGMVVYRHRQFPERYRNGVFSACWTLGRVYFFPLTRDGSSFTTEREIFLQTKGTVGFAPVDMVVGPEGDLFVAVGGRRTRGSVFRVRYVGNGRLPTEPTEPLDRVLKADQPLDAWSRARWMPLARKLGRGPLREAIFQEDRPLEDRIRAIEILTEMFGGLEVETARRIGKLNQPELTARAAWSLGRRRRGEGWQRLVAEWTASEDPRVARAAWESLAAVDRIDPSAAGLAAFAAAAESPDRRVRMAAVLAAARLDIPSAARYLTPAEPGNLRRRIAALQYAYVRDALTLDCFPRAAELFLQCGAGQSEEQLETLRLMQLCLGDLQVHVEPPEVYAGYLPKRTIPDSPLGKTIRTMTLQAAERFPTGNEEVDRELARLAALAAPDGTDALREKLCEKFTPESRVQDDIHYLIVLSRLPGERTEAITRRTAEAIVGLNEKMERDRMYPSRNWPIRVGEAFQQLCRHDEKLPAAILTTEGFGRPDHALLARLMPAGEQQQAARKILTSVEEADEEIVWTPELVELIGSLPAEESLPVLRGLWYDPAAQDAVIVFLARDPRTEDRERFIEALASPQPRSVRLAAEALTRLDGEVHIEQMAAALKALRRFETLQQYADVRDALIALLAVWAEPENPAAPAKTYQAWLDRLAAKYPPLKTELESTFNTGDISAWKKRFTKIDFSRGDAARGETIYRRESCQTCHSGSSRLGPDLRGVTERFSREDLLLAVVDPNRDVSPVYMTVQLTTGAGKSYQGVVIYDSPDGTLLQVGPAETIRIAGQEILSVVPSPLSLMPPGLQNATDQEIADLVAYLKTLQK